MEFITISIVKFLKLVSFRPQKASVLTVLLIGILGFVVFTFDHAHVITAYFLRVDICHGAKLNALDCFLLNINSIYLLLCCR